MIALFYLLGIIACYVIIRLADGKSFDWGEVGLKLFLSLVWPIVLLIFLGCCLLDIFDGKPPKWL